MTSMELGCELVKLNLTAKAQEKEIEKYRLKAAMYRAYFFGQNVLVEKLKLQLYENDNELTGDFDGFYYSSRRVRSKFRTLEDMLEDGLLTEDEYLDCKKVDS